MTTLNRIEMSAYDLCSGGLLSTIQWNRRCLNKVSKADVWEYWYDPKDNKYILEGDFPMDEDFGGRISK